jgi:hypothetical protein
VDADEKTKRALDIVRTLAILAMLAEVVETM